jgi:hypothetical protein
MPIERVEKLEELRGATRRAAGVFRDRDLAVEPGPAW